MLNTTQVKDLVKQRFGGSLKQVYLNKCYNNKEEIADRRNMAFAVDGDVYTNVDLTALAKEIGCKRIKLHAAFLRGMQSGAWLRLQHVHYNKQVCIGGSTHVIVLVCCFRPLVLHSAIGPAARGVVYARGFGKKEVDKSYIIVYTISIIRNKGEAMGKVNQMYMEVQEKIWDNLTEEMVGECENIGELYAKVTKACPEELGAVFGDVITSVCDEAWDQYWGAYV